MFKIGEGEGDPFRRKVPLPPLQTSPPSSPKTFAFIESLFKCIAVTGKKARAGLFRTGFLILVSG